VALSGKDLSLVKVIPVVAANGKSSRVSAVYDARPRASFIATLKDIPEVWEIPYDGVPASREQGSRLRDVTDRESGPATSSQARHPPPGSHLASQGTAPPTAVTRGIGEDKRAKAFEAAHDDYSAILFKSLCDRLAEAFAEHLHLRVRRDFWGYAGEEALTNDELIAEKYQGIRPAPGYPACPEHSEKAGLFHMLDATARIGVKLTENFAMWPGAAVSGFYLSHPDSQYFAVAKIERDQVEDYARRKGWDLKTAERWLAPNLAYQPG
jgi:hypothetical protein